MIFTKSILLFLLFSVSSILLVSSYVHTTPIVQTDCIGVPCATCASDGCDCGCSGYPCESCTEYGCIPTDCSNQPCSVCQDPTSCGCFNASCSVCPEFPCLEDSCDVALGLQPDEHVWISNTSGKWDDVFNWCPPSLPTETSRVTLPSASLPYTIYFGYYDYTDASGPSRPTMSQNLTSLTVQSGVFFDVVGTISASASILIQGTVNMVSTAANTLIGSASLISPNVTVGSGGRLYGIGTIQGNVSVQDDGVLAVRSTFNRLVLLNETLDILGDLYLSNHSLVRLWKTNVSSGSLNVLGTANLAGFLDVCQLQGLDHNETLMMMTWGQSTMSFANISYVNSTEIDLECQNACANVSSGLTHPNSPFCAPCNFSTFTEGVPCVSRYDCQTEFDNFTSGWCSYLEGLCVSCSDGIASPGFETDVDCGGLCMQCNVDASCLHDSDCFTDNYLICSPYPDLTCQFFPSVNLSGSCTTANVPSGNVYHPDISSPCGTIKTRCGPPSFDFTTYPSPSSPSSLPPQTPLPPAKVCGDYSGSGLSVLFSPGGVTCKYCPFGWTNYPVCDVPLCEPLASNLDLIDQGLPNCYGHGTCVVVSNGVTGCNCLPGWKGSDCSVAECLNDCSQRGACLAGPNGGVCQCDQPNLFTGADCSIPVCPNDCSGHGSCELGLGDQPFCQCDRDFGGADCSNCTANCPVTGFSCPFDCHSAGLCLADNVCACNDGYFGETCQYRLCTPNSRGAELELVVDYNATNVANGSPILDAYMDSGLVDDFMTALAFVLSIPSNHICLAQIYLQESPDYPPSSLPHLSPPHYLIFPVFFIDPPPVNASACLPRCPETIAAVQTFDQDYKNGTVQQEFSFFNAVLNYTWPEFQFSNECSLGCGTPDQGFCQFGVCVCMPLWTGSDCSVPSCPGEPDCMNRGVCVSNLTAVPVRYCVCDEFFYGDACQHPICPLNCSGHGSCDVTNHTQPPVCLCDPQYEGAGCETLAKYNSNDSSIDQTMRWLAMGFGIGAIVIVLFSWVLFSYWKPTFVYGQYSAIQTRPSAPSPQASNASHLQLPQVPVIIPTPAPAPAPAPVPTPAPDNPIELPVVYYED